MVRMVLSWKGPSNPGYTPRSFLAGIGPILDRWNRRCVRNKGPISGYGVQGSKDIHTGILSDFERTSPTILLVIVVYNMYHLLL